jgi:hypothetical protein
MNKPIRDHPYEGMPDGRYCTFDYGDDENIYFCTMPRSAHELKEDPSEDRSHE